jgi:hypothetical protein
MLNNFILTVTKNRLLSIHSLNFLLFVQVSRVLNFSTNPFGTEVFILEHSEIQFLLFCNLLCIAMLCRNVLL